MDKSEAAALLISAASCLEQNPNQFTFAVHVDVESMVGLQAGSGGPTTIQAVVSGGTARDVTGAIAKAEVRTGDIEIARGKASEEFNQQIASAAKVLREMANDLNQQSVDEDNVRSRMADLTRLTVPVLVAETARQILRLVGIPA